MNAAVTTTLVEEAAAGPPPWHTLGRDEVLGRQHVDGRSGLTSAEADSRREVHGPNVLAATATEPGWRAFARQYADPMQLVLLVAGIGSVYPIKQLGTGLVVLGLTLVNAVIGLHQEGKAASAVAALERMMVIRARVRRDGVIGDPGADDHR
jgi:Ca2+-transporting ATPase